MERKERCLAKNICLECNDSCSLYLEDEVREDYLVDLDKQANETAKKFYRLFKEKIIGGSKMSDSVFITEGSDPVFDVESLGVTKADEKHKLTEHKIDLGVEKPPKKEIKPKKETKHIKKEVEVKEKDTKVEKSFPGKEVEQPEKYSNNIKRELESTDNLVDFVFNFLNDTRELAASVANYGQNFFTDREFALFILDVFENFIKTARYRIERNGESDA